MVGFDLNPALAGHNLTPEPKVNTGDSRVDVRVHLKAESFLSVPQLTQTLLFIF